MSERKEWEKYLSDHYQRVESRNGEAESPNNGIKFEILVEKLLNRFFCENGRSFIGTKMSHDGNKDFWAIDNFDELWWAECKNYSSKISLTQLAPSLFMAELNQVNHLLFFSYTELNRNLKRRIGEFALQNKKEIFLFDSSSLASLIVEYDKSSPEFIKRKKQSIREELNIDFYNCTNSYYVNRKLYNPYYEICELEVGGVYDINVLLINRHATLDCSISLSIEPSEYNAYFEFINSGNNKSNLLLPQKLLLSPNQITIFRYTVRAIKSSEDIQLPKISVSYNFENQIENTVISTEEKKYSCNWTKKVVLLDSQYNKIIEGFANQCKHKLSGILVFGGTGTGKTRIIEECIVPLVHNGFNIINFTGFDRDASWKDIILEIIYQVFGIQKDVAISIQLELTDIVCEDIVDTEKKKILDLISLIKRKKFNPKKLEEYYDLIFSRLSQQKYAIIIDNLQSYSAQIIEFLNSMLQYFLSHRPEKAISLLISLNQDLIYDKKYLDFVYSFQHLEGINENGNFIYKEIYGFSEEKYAIAYLQTILDLDSITNSYYLLREIVRKTSLRPKFIEIIADRVLLNSCIIEQNNKKILNVETLKNILEDIPPKFENLVAENYKLLLKHYPQSEASIKVVLALLHFWGKIDDRCITSFNLSRSAINKLKKHNILREEKISGYKIYVFDHDWIELSFSQSIYPTILDDAIEFVLQHNEVYISLYTDHIEQYELCRLSKNEMNGNELIQFWTYGHYLKLPNKFRYKTCLFFINNLMQKKNTLEASQFIRLATDCCKYVRDHINEKQASDLFDLAYEHISKLSKSNLNVLKEAFSFTIHYCENKIHLQDANRSLVVYQKFLNVLKDEQEIFRTKKWEFDYAKAYILNRIFVCGKLLGTPGRYCDELKESISIASKIKAWDIQFENFFDYSNVFLQDAVQINKALKCIDLGILFYSKMSVSLKEKYIVNYYSKQILRTILLGKYKDALINVNDAFTELKCNKNIDYHIFFQMKYKRYELLCYLFLHYPENIIDKCMMEYMQILNLTGEYENKIELLHLQSYYASCLQRDALQQDIYKKACEYIELRSTRTLTSREGMLFYEIMLQYRHQNFPISVFDAYTINIEHGNNIMSVTQEEFELIWTKYNTPAPIQCPNGKFGFFV